MDLLKAQEYEVLAELTAAFQKVDKTYLAMKKFEQVVDNAEDRLSAAEADYESNKDGRGFLDLDSLNRARTSTRRLMSNSLNRRSNTRWL